MEKDIPALLQVFGAICAGIWFENLLYPGLSAPAGSAGKIGNILAGLLGLTLGLVTILTHEPTAVPSSLLVSLFFFLLGAGLTHLFTINEQYTLKTEGPVLAAGDHHLRRDAGMAACLVYLLCFVTLISGYSILKYPLFLTIATGVLGIGINAIYWLWQYTLEESEQSR